MMFTNRYQGFHFPQTKWKASTPENKTGYHTVQYVGNVAPKQDAVRLPRKAAPQKFQYRKQYVNAGVSSRPTLQDVIEVPGGTHHTNLATSQLSGNAFYGDKLNKTNNPYCELHMNSTTNKPNANLTQPEKALRKIRNTSIVSKKYYTRHEEYRNQKDSCCKENKEVVSHSNAKYHQQGAVQSSTRMERLKYEEMNKHANSLKDKFADATATMNNSKFRGNYNESYTTKSKTNTPGCHYLRSNGNRLTKRC